MVDELYSSSSTLDRDAFLEGILASYSENNWDSLFFFCWHGYYMLVISAIVMGAYQQQFQSISVTSINFYYFYWIGKIVSVEVLSNSGRQANAKLLNSCFVRLFKCWPFGLWEAEVQSYF